MKLRQSREFDRTLVHQLKLQDKTRFTGKLVVKTTSGLEWTLHFCVGRLVWATGGNHIVRRLYRHLAQLSPQITLEMLALREKNGFKYGWDYQAIDTLVLRKHLVQERAPQLITKIVDEVLFDILQFESRDWLSYHYEPIEIQDSDMGFFILLNIPKTLKRLSLKCQAWKAAKIGNFSLKFAPVLQDLPTLKSKIRPSHYQTLVKSIDGKRTLREVAAFMHKDEIQLVRWLCPLIRRGYVQLGEVPDLPRPEIPNQSTRFLETAPLRAKPLIACVDDSPQVCWQMQQILEKAGYHFLGIQDSIHALGISIERKPDLIFIDLMMPIVSGYELCTQIRRVSELRNVPIVILSGGIVDRLRAKIVGASECLAKPIDARKVLATATKYLGNSLRINAALPSAPKPSAIPENSS